MRVADLEFLFSTLFKHSVFSRAVYLGLMLCIAQTGFSADPILSVSAGHGHSLFIKPDGSLWGMGDNHAGQLGNGNPSTEPNSLPLLIATDVTSASAGEVHGFFIKSDASLWAM